MQSLSVELMQIIEIVTTIATSKYIDMVLIAISCMHVAWTWWLTGERVV